MIALLSLAWAQVPDDLPKVDTQLFRPTTHAQHTHWTQDATRLPHLYWTVGLTGHYARDPFVWIGPEDESTFVITDVITSSLTGGAQLGPVWVGAHVPFVLRAGGHYGGETGLGDISVESKGVLVDHDQAPVGVAVSGEILLPTATLDAQLGGGAFRWQIEGVLDKPVGPFLLAMNLGYQNSPKRVLEGLTYRGQLYTRLGAGLGITERLEASLEVVAGYNLGGFNRGAGLPAEVMGGFGWRILPPLEVRIGAGTGLTGAIGVPIFRGLLGVHYAPPITQDADKDGVTDDIDRCRTEPEDFDGVEDSDGCPEPTRVTVRVEDRNGEIVGAATWMLQGEEPAEGKSGDAIARFPGAYTLAAEARGYASNTAQVRIRDGKPQDVTVVLDKIVLPGRVKVSITDDEGGPIPGAHWWFEGDDENERAPGVTVERLPGTYEVRVEAPSFRPQTLPFELKEDGEQTIAVRLQLARVVLQGEQILIKDSIFFETGRATIKAESHGLLDEVAQVLQDNPELKKVRIEGHTDSRGSAFNNLELSQLRADAVAAYLASRGVDRTRLDPIGFGEERPLVPGNDEAAWSKNRRVDFFVVEREEAD